ncbi:MAG TPA: HAD family phosphatase [Alphaproteobacteria bacterium]|nr:HAD family phosphatase [Alphaproteobacteria bacterium]HNS43725.1 HAD family phosphatase [Alphaproteobacteria bacterium]
MDGLVQVSQSEVFALLQRFVSFYDGVLIDFDGTQVKAEETRAQIRVNILKDAGIDVGYDEMFRLKGLEPDQILDRLAMEGRLSSVPGSRITTLRNDIVTLHREKYAAALEEAGPEVRRDGMVEFMTAFNHAAKPVITVSNSPLAIVDFGSRIAGYKDSGLVSGFITADDVFAAGKQKKPFPDPFDMGIELAFTVAGVKGKRYLIIDDSLVGYNSALAAGKVAGVECHVMGIYYDQVSEEPDSRCRFAVKASGGLMDFFTDAALAFKVAGRDVSTASEAEILRQMAQIHRGRSLAYP